MALGARAPVPESMCCPSLYGLNPSSPDLAGSRYSWVGRCGFGGGCILDSLYRLSLPAGPGLDGLRGCLEAQGPTTDSLLDVNLPVQLPSDRNPGDLSSVQALVHTSKNDLSTLRSLLPTEDTREGKG